LYSSFLFIFFFFVVISLGRKRSTDLLFLWVTLIDGLDCFRSWDDSIYNGYRWVVGICAEYSLCVYCYFLFLCRDTLGAKEIDQQFEQGVGSFYLLKLSSSWAKMNTKNCAILREFCLNCW
jgi:hypothetical protein